MIVRTGEVCVQEEFEGFSEWLETFDLYRGKRTGEETEEDARSAHNCFVALTRDAPESKQKL